MGYIVPRVTCHLMSLFVTFGLALLTANTPLAVVLSMPDTTIMAGDSLRLPVLVDSIPASPGVLAYQVFFQFDSLQIVGIGADANGAVTERLGEPFHSGGAIAGELRIAAAGLHPVSGVGALCYVTLRALPNSVGSASITISSALLNEGTPPVSWTNPISTITIRSTSIRHEPKASQPSPIIIAPQPSSGIIRITLPENTAEREVHLVDILGRESGRYRLSSGHSVTVSHLSSGIYFLVTPEEQQPVRIVIHK
ncbi:MAG: T9SS type A sorting domain-containing protein [bacterium]|nr:T9SS type A sorting domain-containing protein [bacterium]